MLGGDPATLGIVRRWIAQVLTSPRYWALRPDWPDLQQEVLRRVVESLDRGRFDPKRDFCRYVQGVARNTARRAHRRAMEVPIELVPEPTEKNHAEDQADARMFARRVLDSATPICRELIRLYFLEQRSYEEIAAKLDTPVGTIKSKLFRCLACARRRTRRPTPSKSETSVS